MAAAIGKFVPTAAVSPNRQAGDLVKKAVKDNLFIILMLLPSILITAIFIYFPILKGIPNAFRNDNLWNINDRQFVGLRNFQAILADPSFSLAVPNTVIWVFASLFFQVLIGFILALFLKKKFKGRGLYEGLIFFPWAVSGFMIGIIWRWLYNGVYGPVNDLLIKLGVVTRATTIGFLSDSKFAMGAVIFTNIWYGIAFFAIMIQAALEGVPDDLYEAAMVDGAGKIKQFTKITVPQIYPVLVFTILLRSIWIFNFADLIYGMTQGGPGGHTQILTSYMMNLIIFNNDYGKASAVGIMVCIILLLWSFLYLKVSSHDREEEIL